MIPWPTPLALLALFATSPAPEAPIALATSALATCALATCAPLPITLAYDSWRPFENRRAVSQSGRRYLVVRLVKGEIHYELCERRKGAPAMQAVRQSHRDKGKSKIDRDPKDKLIVEGKVKQLPIRVRVLDTPGGFLFFERYGRIGFGKALIYVNDAGKIVTQKTVVEIFGAMPKNSRRTVSSIWWYRGFRVDEKRKTAVFVSKDDEIREVSLTDGSISKPRTRHLIGWCRRGTLADRILALELASERKGAERALISAEAVEMARDRKEPIEIRLRAAVLATRAGAAKGETFAELFKSTCRGLSDDPGISYAIGHLSDILGVAAMPILRELMRGAARRNVWNPAQGGFARLGKKAVPVLCAMVLEKNASPDYRGGAAHALAKIGSAKADGAIDALLEATAKAEDYTANAALNAAIKIGTPKLSERLLAILDDTCSQDGRIGLYFQSHPTRAALPALRRAQERFTPSSSAGRWIREAIFACEKQ